MTVTVVERELRINGQAHLLAFPICDAFQLGPVILVMFDPDSDPKKFGQFQNVIALDVEGNVVWEADLPTSNTGDRYYRVASRDPLTLNSTQSYDVILDPTSGRILDRRFTK